MGKQGCLKIALLSAFATGCGPSTPATAGSSTGGAAETSAVTSSSDSSGTASASGSTTTSTTGTTSSSSGLDPDDGTGCAGFLCQPDGGSYYGECSIFTQDCPQGEKCNPYADDGGPAWNAWRCVPVTADPDPVGSPCTAEGASGIDSCDREAMCWQVDPGTGLGTCTPHCDGTELNPHCNDPARACYIPAIQVIALCLPLCDPLLQNCAEGEGCYDDYDNRFMCAPDASGPGGALFGACEAVNECASGSICVNAALIDACDQGTVGCCSSFCDVDDDTCPDATVCVPWFESGQTPPGYEDVGVCLSPMG